MSASVIITGVEGIGEIVPGDDLSTLLLGPLREITWPDGGRGLAGGDIIVVTSKIISKAEGQLRPAHERERVIAEDTIEIIAEKTTPRGRTKIVRNRHGVVLAAAGVDESNAPEGQILLLPRDPDASAAHLRQQWESAFGFSLGVVVTDTLGRAWREGLTDAAIGVSGVAALDDLRGHLDTQGVPLEVTVIAIADEIAAAADLVKGKATGRPVAVVRGLSHYVGHDSTAADLIRDPAGDLFTLGTAEARALGRREAPAARRTVRTFTEQPVAAQMITNAIADAILAPAPHHTRPWRFIWPSTPRIRTGLLDAMAAQWRVDLSTLDGLDDAAIDTRLKRGNVLREATEIICAFVDVSDAHRYSDVRRHTAERDLFIAAGAAGVQNLMLRLAAEGLGSAWVSSSMFCPDTLREFFDLPDTWIPLGIVGLGWPSTTPPDRPGIDDLPLQRL